VVLRAPVVRAAAVADAGSVGIVPEKGPDGAERPLATAYASGAYLHMGPTDLTGVGAVRVALQSLGHPVTVELRAGGVDGALVGSVDVPNRKDTWAEAVVPVRPAGGGSGGGERDLYLVLRSGARDLGQWNPLARVDVIRFERGAPTLP
jgi:hypothetical protein